MLKRTIKYQDFLGNPREEDFHFNLTKAEIAEMELSYEGGFVAMINRAIAAQDQPTLVQIFKNVILTAYGEVSADGRRFIKNDEVREAFSQTQAYSDLFMELATNADAAATFINGIVPEVE